MPSAILIYKMRYTIPLIKALSDSVQDQLKNDVDPKAILSSDDFKKAVSDIKTQPNELKATYGKEMNMLKQGLSELIEKAEIPHDPQLDISANMDVNSEPPQLFNVEQGSRHPTSKALEEMSEIFLSMGFEVLKSREIDDEYHMFDSLNFPKGHPARDEYDNFLLSERDASGKPLLAPAHTSTMQVRYMKERKDLLEDSKPIAFIVPDKVFRNEDLDARHEHTFYQLEGVFVSEDASVANLNAVIESWLSSYFQQDVEIKTQPFYFPFTEPSFEFAISCPFCQKKGCNVCSEGWLELGGCGMIHPNVLKSAEIDPTKYSGFAWGFGIERMIMIKHSIEDVRHFHSADLRFLRQFK